MPVEAQNAQKRASKLLIGQRVAERINGTVEVAQPIGDVVHDVRNSAERRAYRRTKSDQQW